MAAAVKAGNPPDIAYTSNVSIQQMHLLDLLEDVTDVVDEAISKYGNIMPGINAEKFGKIDGKWYCGALHRQHQRLLLPRRQAEGSRHRPEVADDLGRPARGGAGDLGPGQRILGLGPDARTSPATAGAP